MDTVSSNAQEIEYRSAYRENEAQFFLSYNGGVLEIDDDFKLPAKVYTLLS